MKYEDQLEKMKMENNALSDTVQKNAQDLVRLEEQCHTLELELTISQEKHRTCQQEVSNLGYYFLIYLSNCFYVTVSISIY